MAKHIFGLANVLMGAIAADGDMSTTLQQLGETVSGTATMEAEDDTTQDFLIEESDVPVESVISEYGRKTMAWSTYDVSGATMYRLFGGTYKPFKSVATLGTIVGGTGYASATYNNLPLTGGTGKGARANITVTAGAVSAVVLVDGGEGYTVSDSLSVPNSLLGGTGSGFSVPVGTLANGAATNTTWEEPENVPSLELSLQITDKKGNIIKIPRAKIVAKWTNPFAKDRMGQIDLVATILQPTKAGVPRRSIIYANS